MNLRRLESLLLSPLPWLHLSLESFHQFHPANLLYHLHRGCKLLKMTWSIVDRKLMNLRRLESLLLSLPPWLRLFCHLFTSSIIRLSVLSFVSFSEWPDILLIEKLINLGRLVSLLTSPSLAVTICSCVYGCAWVVRSSVSVCCLLWSVPPSASTSAISVPVSGLLAPLSRWLWVWLGRLLLCLCLLCAWVRSSVCAYICFVFACAWFVCSSVILSIAVSGSSAEPVSTSTHWWISQLPRPWQTIHKTGSD